MARGLIRKMPRRHSHLPRPLTECGADVVLRTDGPLETDATPSVLHQRTLDGCCDHRAIPADEDLHRHAIENLNQADALLFGRVTYEMMESVGRNGRREASVDS